MRCSRQPVLTSYTIWNHTESTHRNADWLSEEGVKYEPCIQEVDHYDDVSVEGPTSDTEFRCFSFLLEHSLALLMEL